MGDWWCPNCRQHVKPTVRAKPVMTVSLIAFALLVLGYMQTSGGDLGPATLVVLAVSVAAAAIFDRDYSCPICKSTNVKKQAPTE
jgi:hypothetical protein